MRCLPALLLPLCLVACMDHGAHEDEPVDCTMVSGADTFVVGLSRDGGGGQLGFAMMSAEPAPPARGDNIWVVQVSDPGGTPMDGMNLTVTPFMPAHQHGTPIMVGVTPAGTAGQYTLSPVNLWMPGVWETTIRAQSGATVDSATFTFCIN
jgi:YtkA-like